MDQAAQWGLPPGFTPVRYVISDDAKVVVRDLLKPNEPVIVSISNEGDTIAIVATPFRVLVVKTAGLGAGRSGASVKEYPWEGIFDIVLSPLALNVKFAIHYRSVDGRTVEVGRRAMIAKPHVDNLMAYEKAGGQEVFKALLKIWNYKKAMAAQAE